IENPESSDSLENIEGPETLGNIERADNLEPEERTGNLNIDECAQNFESSEIVEYLPAPQNVTEFESANIALIIAENPSTDADVSSPRISENEKPSEEFLTAEETSNLESDTVETTTSVSTPELQPV
ncbi:unnamed protein product, partial [Allacma fusca]